MLAALAHGIPQVMVPITTDQLDKAERGAAISSRADGSLVWHGGFRSRRPRRHRSARQSSLSWLTQAIASHTGRDGGASGDRPRGGLLLERLARDKTAITARRDAVTASDHAQAAAEMVVNYRSFPGAAGKYLVARLAPVGHIRHHAPMVPAPPGGSLPPSASAIDRIGRSSIQAEEDCGHSGQGQAGRLRPDARLS
jgi:hypothetical protein